MSFSPPPSKQAKHGSPINKLTEAELSEVFKRLPPFERLLVSEVCRLWHKISRKAWLDVTTLDLSPIPGAHIRVIIKQCPNLQSVFALRKCFEVNALSCLRDAQKLSCVKLYDCTFSVRDDSSADVYDYISKILSEHLQQASWNELVLHNDRIAKVVHNDRVENISNVWGYHEFPSFTCNAEALPASLTRLQRTADVRNVFASGLEQLQNLECLMLTRCYAILINESDSLHSPLDQKTINITAMQKLREICLEGVHVSVLKLIVSRLSQLQVLCVRHIHIFRDDNAVEHFTDVVTKPSALRILVLAGELRGSGPKLARIPARKRYPNGFGSDPLPLLNIFVSNEVSRWIHFTPSDAATVHHVREPMSVFLERADAAPFFEGVWVAEKIKEATKYDAELWFD